jgi:allantoinase
MVERGAVGFKAFLCHSGIDDFPASGRDVLREAMRILRDLGVPLLVHAELEDPAAVPPLEIDPDLDPAALRRLYTTYLHSRPKAWEDAAIAMMIELLRETGCPVHVVHLSSATALPLIRAAKRDGLPLTVETCPHYLCLVAEEVPDGATEYKCAPPVREAANRSALWAGLRDGTIDFVVSDHSPCTPGLKLPDRGDFLDAWGGIASLQLGLANVWTEARRRGFGIADLVRWMSAGPAAFLGLKDRGGIRPGGRADLVAWSPDAEHTVDAAALHHRHKVTPYHGRRVAGRVERTWLAGRVIDLTDAGRAQCVLRPRSS